MAFVQGGGVLGPAGVLGQIGQGLVDVFSGRASDRARLRAQQADLRAEQQALATLSAQGGITLEQLPDRLRGRSVIGLGALEAARQRILSQPAPASATGPSDLDRDVRAGGFGLPSFLLGVGDFLLPSPGTPSPSTIPVPNTTGAQRMPFLPTSESFFGNVLGGLVQQAPAIIQAFRGPTAPQAAGFTGFEGFGLPGVDAVPDQTPGASMGAAACISPRTSGVSRFPARVQFMHGDRVVSYRNEGRPLLYSGDVAAKRRVEKVGRKVGRRRPR